MSQAKVQAVRTILTAFSGRDLVALLRETEPDDLSALVRASFHAQVELAWVATNPDAGPYRGHDGALRALRDWLASFDQFFFEPTESSLLATGSSFPTAKAASGRTAARRSR